jgi:hypothetical protein
MIISGKDKENKSCFWMYICICCCVLSRLFVFLVYLCARLSSYWLFVIGYSFCNCLTRITKVQLLTVKEFPRPKKLITYHLSFIANI